MRTKNLFKVVTTAIVTVALSGSGFAQLTTAHIANSTDTTTPGEKPNVVTVGARVPFATQSSSSIWALEKQGVLAPQSVWKWQISPTGPTMYASDGTSSLTTPGLLGAENIGVVAPGYVSDSAISIDFPALGNFGLYVTERSVSNIPGITGCEGNVQHLAVQVVSAPTIVFNDADRIIGGCGADIAADNNIPITVSGNGPFSTNGGLHITYNITYKDLAGTTSNIVPTGTIIADGGSEFSTGWAQFSVNQGPTNTHINFNITDGNYGTYTVTLEAITDEVSRKTLETKAGYDTQGLPVLAQRTLTIYALPTPTTQPIKAIKNIGW
jgi:hypothetical protein